MAWAPAAGASSPRPGAFLSTALACQHTGGRARREHRLEMALPTSLPITRRLHGLMWYSRRCECNESSNTLPLMRGLRQDCDTRELIELLLVSDGLLSNSRNGKSLE